MRVVWLIGMLLVSAAHGAESVSRAELERCGALGDDIERLACYDRLAGRDEVARKPTAAASSEAPPLPVATTTTPAPAKPPAEEAVSASPPVPVADASAPTRPSATVAAEEVGAAPAGQAPGSAQASDTSATQQEEAAEDAFGLEKKQAKQDQTEKPKRITSRIRGTFSGWSGDTEFELANGQVWRQAQAGRLIAPDVESPAVTISRGFLGVYYLKVAGYNQRVKVERVK